MLAVLSTAMSAPESARFLADSPDRLRLLTHLRETPAPPQAIAEALSISQRSVQRNLSAFVDRGWAEKADGVYQLTTTGELITDEHATYIDVLDRIHEFEPLFRHLPDDSHAPDPRWLQDATLAVGTPDDPQAPVHYYVTALREFETDTIRMIAPVLSRLFHDAHAKLALRGVQTELVMSETMIDRARELNPAEFDVVVSAGVLHLYRYPGEVAFGLTLGSSRALLCAYDAEGQLHACLDTSSSDAMTWAKRLYECYRNRSTRVEPPLSFRFKRPNG